MRNSPDASSIPPLRIVLRPVDVVDPLDPGPLRGALGLDASDSGPSRPVLDILEADAEKGFPPEADNLDALLDRLPVVLLLDLLLIGSGASGAEGQAPGLLASPWMRHHVLGPVQLPEQNRLQNADLPDGVGKLT